MPHPVSSVLNSLSNRAAAADRDENSRLRQMRAGGDKSPGALSRPDQQARSRQALVPARRARAEQASLKSAAAEGPRGRRQKGGQRGSILGAFAGKLGGRVAPQPPSEAGSSSDGGGPEGGAPPQRVRKNSMDLGANTLKDKRHHAGMPDPWAVEREVLNAAVPGELARCMIQHDAAWKKRWDLWVALLIIYSVLMVPVKVGWSWSACIFEGDWWFDIIVDSCFALDIIFCFRTVAPLSAPPTAPAGAAPMAALPEFAPSASSVPVPTDSTDGEDNTLDQLMRALG